MGAAPIFIVSGGSGASGEQLVRTALAQFPAADVPITVVPHVRSVAQIEALTAQAAAAGATIVHTLVDAHVRHALIQAAYTRNVVAIDLIGPLLGHLSSALHQAPLGQPGLYRSIHREYFERIAAIEFAVAHDDGANPAGWPDADIVLAGVSRVGKTPLSMYIAMQGWKVANVSLVRDLPPPAMLLQLDPHRVVGLVIDPERLAAHRRARQQRLGLPLGSYADMDALDAELEQSRRIFRQAGIPTVDVTDKPIEVLADTVIGLVSRWQSSG